MAFLTAMGKVKLVIPQTIIPDLQISFVSSPVSTNLEETDKLLSPVKLKAVVGHSFSTNV